MSIFKFSKIKMSRKTKIIIGLTISVIAIVLIISGLWVAWNNMYRDNPRFYLWRVNVTSAEGQGRWHGKVNEVMPIVEKAKISHEDEKDTKKETKKFVKEPVNLFDIDVKKLREELEHVPEIEKVEVRRILPNTLDIKIVERIPLAFLGTGKSEKLIDKDCVVIRKKHSIDISGMIPIIYGYKEKLPEPGKKFEDAKAALEYILLTKKVADYASLRIVEMDLAKEKFITMKIHYGGDEMDWYLIQDVPRDDPQQGMERILLSINASKKEGKERRKIVLRFEGQSVLKKSETEQNEDVE